MDFMTSAVVVSWAAIFLLALVVSGLIRQVHQLTKNMNQPNRAVPVSPAANAPQVTELLRGKSGVLLFLTETCPTCTEVLDEATSWLSENTDTTAVAAVYSTPAPSHPTIPVSGERTDLFTAYDAIATPFAVVLDDNGKVARSEPVGSRKAIRTLLESTNSTPQRSS